MFVVTPQRVEAHSYTLVMHHVVQLLSDVGQTKFTQTIRDVSSLAYRLQNSHLSIYITLARILLVLHWLSVPNTEPELSGLS